MASKPSPAVSPMHIAVIGPCASGKSTLVAGLRAHGYDAYDCAQEHSEIPTLWRHLDPDVVIALDVDLATIRERRGEDWPETIFRHQIRRLASARAAADAIIDTAVHDASTTLTRALAVVSNRADLSGA